MATHLTSASSSPVAAILSAGTGAATAFARFATSPTSAFASLLDQLGQPLQDSPLPLDPALASEGTSLPATAALDQPSPTAPSLVPSAPLPQAFPLLAPTPASASLDVPNAQPLEAGAATGLKPAAKKAITPLTADSSAVPAEPVAATPMLPPAPPPLLPPAAGLIVVPHPSASPAAATSSTFATGEAISASAETAPPKTSSIPAAPPASLTMSPDPDPNPMVAPTSKAAPTSTVSAASAASPTSTPAPVPTAANIHTAAAVPPAAPDPSSTPAKTSSTTSSSPPAETPTPSRIVGQAAAAAQAGLSVDKRLDEDVKAPRPQSEPQQAITALSHVDPASATPLIPPATPQIPSTTNPPAVVEPVAPTRADNIAPSRAIEPDAPSPGPSTATSSVVQPSLSPASDSQPLTPLPPPTSMLMATGPVASTRPAPVTPPPPSPATQVAQAIVEPVKVILTSPAQASPTTPHVTTIQITPAELGRVDVRIERTADGPAKIQLIAERPETLLRLVHDQSQLQQALDHVGILQNSRTIEFSLAPATTDPGSFASSLAGNNTSGGGASGSGFQRQNNGYFNHNLNQPDDNHSASPTQSRTIRTGIDITA